MPQLCRTSELLAAGEEAAVPSHAFLSLVTTIINTLEWSRQAIHTALGETLGRDWWLPGNRCNMDWQPGLNHSEQGRLLSIA